MYTLRKSLFSLGSAVAVLLLTAAAQATLNVPSQYASIQAAINAAAVGDTIVVAAGTYHESLSWIRKDLTIQGAGEGMSIIDPGVANGGPGGRCLSTESLSAASRLAGFTFQNGSTATNTFGGGMVNYLSNLVVTNCTFTQNSAGSGGGMYNATSNATVTNCTFSGNTATDFGGGMANRFGSMATVTNCTFTQNEVSDGVGGGMGNAEHSSLTVTNCAFTQNVALNIGGGMYNEVSSVTLIKCTFTKNTLSSGDSGGGISNNQSYAALTDCDFTQNVVRNGHGGGMDSYNSSKIFLTHCTFVQNTALFGGGMDNQTHSTSAVTNCLFSGNTAGFHGGGMENNFVDSSTVTNCTFILNTAAYGGGMFNTLSDMTLANCLFTQNTVSNSGGGLYNDGSNTSMTNCTISQNAAPGNLGGGIVNIASSLILTNSIVYSNTAFLFPGIYGIVSSKYSDVQGGFSATPDANGNFTANPFFADPAKGDLHLSATSPCRNRGNNAVILSPPFSTVSGTIVDLDGNPRIVDSAVDLGAYEYQVSSPILSVPSSVSGTVGQAVNFTASATPPFPGDTLTFSLVNPPAGASINSATGQVTFTTSVAGTHSLQVKVTDTLGLSDTRSVQAVIASNPSGTSRVLMTNLQTSRLNATTITVSFSLLNSGTATAQSVRVTAAKLKGIAASVLAGPFSIPAGNSQNVTLTFVSSTLTPGTAAFTLNGSYTGSSFSSGLNQVLP